MMKEKALTAVNILVNLAGIACLVYCAVPLILHDTAVPNPEAMLPMQRWEAGGWCLLIGLIPLFIANVFGFQYLAKEKLRGKGRFLFFLPCAVCLGLVVYYLVISLI